MSLLDTFNKSDKKVSRTGFKPTPNKSKHVGTSGTSPTQVPTYSIFDLDGKIPKDTYKSRLPK